MSLNIKTDDGYISVAGGSVEPLKYTAITGAGVTVNNDPESTGYRTIENTGVHSIETGTDKDNANGTILVQTGVASATNPAKPVAVKGLNNAAYKDVDTKVDSTTKTSEKLPTTKAVYDTLKKIEDGVFQRDTDAVSVKTVPSGVKNYAVVEKIYGKTVKFNQIFDYTGTRYFSNVTATMSNGLVTLSGSNASSTGLGITLAWTDFNIVAGHKYVYRSSIPLPSGDIIVDQYNLNGSDSVLDKVITARANYAIPQIYHKNASTTYTGISGRLMIFDLTTMFGAGNEPTISEFNRIVPNEVYEPTGTLWNATVESVVSQSDNLVNPSEIVQGSINSSGVDTTITTRCRTGFVKVNPSSTLYAKVTYPIIYDVYQYDSSKNYVKVDTLNSTSGTITTASNTAYIKMIVRKGSNADISPSEVSGLSLKDNTSDYTPYFHNEIELSEAIKSLPDFGCSVGDKYNYADFETGKYYHNVGSVDLGSLTWTSSYVDGGSNVRFSAAFSGIKTVSASTTVGNLVCGKYDTISADNTYHSINGISVGVSSSIIFYDSSITASDLVNGKISKLNGIMLNYELADSAKEVKDISDIIRPIKCETGGTITLKNEHNLDVANTIIYEKEVL